jgi:hypothetical protein
VEEVCATFFAKKVCSKLVPAAVFGAQVAATCAGSYLEVSSQAGKKQLAFVDGALGSGS